MADIELLPFQKEAMAKLLAPGTRKLVIADRGLGTRTMMAQAAMAHNNCLVVAPSALKNDWLKQSTKFKFMRLNQPHINDVIRGLRYDLAMVEIYSLTSVNWGIILDLIPRVDNIWIRIINPSYKDVLLLSCHGFKVIRVDYDGSGITEG